MSSPSQLRTARLLLRAWRETDHAPFAALNADPMVMEYFPDRLTRAESDDLIARIEAGFATHGYGLWAVEVRATGEFVGFTGLAVPSFAAHFTPAVEVGWRLARSAWGNGYATEAALAAIVFGFADAGLAFGGSWRGGPAQTPARTQTYAQLRIGDSSGALNQSGGRQPPLSPRSC